MHAEVPGPRLSDAWKFSNPVKKLATLQSISTLLTRLYGRKAFPFQTLNFPVGTQQHFHTDHIHFSSYPERFMVGVWVALEDIGMDQGPLYYYPGSHKFPILENIHYGKKRFSDTPSYQADYHDTWVRMVKATGLEKKYFQAKKGDILIWSSNLFHGGSKHLNLDKTRWSQVTHYYFENCIYYKPMESNFKPTQVQSAERVNICTEDLVNSTYLGQEYKPDGISEASSSVGIPELPKDFNPDKYLELNPDVKFASVDPMKHYIECGFFEGRKYS